MALPKRLGFEMCRIEIGGHPRRAARFSCVDCNATLDVAIKNGTVLAPDLVAKIAARDHHWLVDAEKANATRCPACQTSRAAVREQPPPEDTIMPTEKVTQIKPIAAVVPPTPLTTDQRVAIRSYLDKHFDDAVGVYLDEMSDQRIAEALDVPRIHIEQVREAAYGPIRTDPAVAKMQADIAAFRREIAEQEARLAQLLERAVAMEAALPKLSQEHR